MRIEDLEKIKSLTDRKTTLKATSYDKNNDVYMVESQQPAVDFDKVKEDYIKNLKLSVTPKSNDALLWENNGRIFFVEFKNGDLRTERFSLSKKIYDSVLIFTDLTNSSISDMRNSVEYVLVYNFNVNTKFIQKSREDAEKTRSEDEEKIILGTELMKLGEEEFILCDLEKFQNYCFKSVHTYTVSQFQEYLSHGANGSKC